MEAGKKMAGPHYMVSESEVHWAIHAGSVVKVKGSKLEWCVWYVGPEFFRASAVSGKGASFKVHKKEAAYSAIVGKLEA